MLTALIILIILASLLLWLVFLIQNPKGGDLSSQFGGSSVSNIIGAKHIVDVIENAPWIVGIAVFILFGLSAYVSSPSEGDVGPGIEGGANIEATDASNEGLDPNTTAPFNGTGGGEPADSTH